MKAVYPLPSAVLARSEVAAAVEQVSRHVAPERRDSADDDCYRRAVALVRGELAASLAKWGRQDHPGAPHTSDPANACALLGLPSVVEARALCEDAARERRCTWGAIVLEELCEAVDASAVEDANREQGLEFDPGEADTEIAQAAAVLVAWLAHRLRAREG